MAATVLLPAATATAADPTGSSASSAAATSDPSSPAGDGVLTDLTVASFNVLGGSHTRNSRRYATGVQRMGGALRLLARHDVDVVGFQELQGDQRTAFLAGTAGTFSLYSPNKVRYDGTPIPGTLDPDNSIAWDAAQWQLVYATQVTIPYFNGRLRGMPLILLRNVQTGMAAWFADFHAPATNPRHRGQDGYRAEAIRSIAELGDQLRRTSYPLFITGDMNERADAFCPIVGDGHLRAARGGYVRRGVCNPKHPWFVDWVFTHRKVRVTGYTEDHSRLDKRITDHPVIAADMEIDPANFPYATLPASPYGYFPVTGVLAGPGSELGSDPGGSTTDPGSDPGAAPTTGSGVGTTP